MSERTESLTERLTDQLANLITAKGEVTAERCPEGVTIAGTDLCVSVAAIWDNPDKPPPGSPRSFGVQIALDSVTLFEGTALEYSYGAGFDDDEAALNALEKWVEFDLPVLTEAFSDQLRQCQRWDFGPNENNGMAMTAGKWQIYVGPLWYMAGEEGAQPCCNACLLVMCLPSLLPIITATPTSCAVKIVASKDENGETSADCRCNGEDLPDAIRAIAEAAKAWPQISGTQLRRQYVYFKAPSS